MSVEPQIKDILRSLFAGIAQADGAVILAETARLDALLSANRATLHPQLRHFLEGRSYAKALMFLGGESDIPVGVCGGGKGQRRSGEEKSTS